jgi:hypothetical protein
MMSDAAMFRAGDMMTQCWALAAKMSDEELELAIKEAKQAQSDYRFQYRRFLWWRFETAASKLEWERRFNKAFYLEDAKKMREAKKRLGISERDIALMTRDQWLGFLQLARA